MITRHAKGLTLIELLIVIVILSIVAAIGYPLMTKYVQKARRAEAKSALQDLALRETRWRVNNTTYTSTLSDLTDLSPATTLPTTYYTYSVVAASTTASAFKVQADGSGTSQATDTQNGTSCKILTVNASSGHGSSAACW
jgi:type IV pilus assembly protein PilE